VAASALFESNGRLAGFHPDEKLEEYVQLVGLSLSMESDRPELFQGFHFAVIDSNDVNAFAAPGGFVFVTAGALRAMENEDELAGVLGHEIAHVVLRHPEEHANNATRQAGLMKGLKTGGAIAGGVLSALGYGREVSMAAPLAQGLGNVVDGFLQEVMVNGYGRKSELAADAMSVQLMGKLGYSPGALKAFVSRLPKKDRGAWTTHPDLEGRGQAIDEEVKKLSAPPQAVKEQRTARFKAAVAALKGP
jgi:predicted Zn-dependent protease